MSLNLESLNIESLTSALKLTKEEVARRTIDDISYSSGGPYGAEMRSGLKVAGSDMEHAMDITVTLPVERWEPMPGPNNYPVVLMINGFQLRASWYRDWARRLASWGFAVVQYDTPLPSPLPCIVTDDSEVKYFPMLVDWMKARTKASSGFLAGQLDVSDESARLAVTGHSRGGKLAGLLFAKYPELIRAAVLIDPVEFLVPSLGSTPSASKAIAESGRPFGIIGAGRVGLLEPFCCNYKAFYKAAPAGTWQVVVSSAGHSSFIALPWLLYWLMYILATLVYFVLDKLLGWKFRHGASSKATLPLAMPPMIAALEEILLPSKAQEGRKAEYERWASGQQTAGNLQFDVQPEN